MEKRRLGRTQHMSTIIVFGGAALGKVSQREADMIVELALEHGVNHFDVAPSYGEAELRLAPCMKDHRDDIFLACKTQKRTREEASEELHRSLERLGVDYFDLYQLHAVDELRQLDAALGPGGAIEAVLEARERGLVRHIGITGHHPAVQVEALRRFDFDTVMFPLNFVLRRHRNAQNDYEPLLKLAEEKDVGAMAIKSIAKQPWQTEAHTYSTWYEPFDTQESIDRSLWFVLSQGVTAAVSASDIRLVPRILDAAERFEKLSEAQQSELIAAATDLIPLFPQAKKK